MLIENVVKSEMLGKIPISGTKEKVTQYVYDGQDLITDDQKKRFNENDDTTTDESNGTINRGQINDDDQLLMNGTSIDDKLQLYQKLEIYWVNVIAFAILHMAALYAIYVGVTQAKLLTLPYMYLVGQLTSFGFSCGAHRLWTHRSYKAKAPLQYILAFLFMMSFQHNLYKWCRNHRVHHRYSDTDADPHNIRRGFFFAHIGWLMCQSHPRVLEARTKVYLDDLDRDPVVQFERRYHLTLGPIVWGVLPVLIPYYCWGESLWAAWFTCVIYRYTTTLNLAWSLNSLAHIYGNKPYDKHIMATESPIKHVLMGESYHNYHHTFPWDYSHSEYDIFDAFNPASWVIDFFAWLGWAYDLRKASATIVKQRKMRTGQSVPMVKTNIVYDSIRVALNIMLPLYPFLFGYLIMYLARFYSTYIY